MLQVSLLTTLVLLDSGNVEVRIAGTQTHAMFALSLYSKQELLVCSRRGWGLPKYMVDRQRQAG
jgi:hypothetical protein